jgi:hypothetical protein
MNNDAKVSFLENEVHRLTELVRLYAEEAQRLRHKADSVMPMVRPRAPTITQEEAAFARDMAISAFDIKDRKRA